MCRICQDLKKIPSDVIVPKLIEYKNGLVNLYAETLQLKFSWFIVSKLLQDLSASISNYYLGVLFIEWSLIIFWSTESLAFPSQLSISCTRWTGCLVLCITFETYLILFVYF